MAAPLTNKMFNQLLSDLSFEPGDLTDNNHRAWRHPSSGCMLLLPGNKSLDPPRPADLVGLRAQLNLHGHLSEAAFDHLIAHGELPAHAIE